MTLNDSKTIKIVSLVSIPYSPGLIFILHYSTSYLLLIYYVIENSQYTSLLTKNKEN